MSRGSPTSRPLFAVGVSALLLMALVSLSWTLTASAARADDKKIVIGSGGVTGVYYPVAISICRLFNAHRTDHGYSCAVESTGGSVQNLKKLRDGSVNFAIVQSDWQFNAYRGKGIFAKVGPYAKLRSVLALYPEAFTVLARSKTNIGRFDDLHGHRVNIGNPGSGQRATMELVMRAFGWTRFSFTLIREFGSQHQARALCDNEVDAIVFVAGHPSGTIKSATTQCGSHFVDVSGPLIDALIADNDYYRRAVIPAGMYAGQKRDVITFGVGATLVTTSETSGKLVETLLKSIYDNLDLFKTMHPALANLKPEEMRKDGLAAPLHDAVVAYYRESGS